MIRLLAGLLWRQAMRRSFSSPRQILVSIIVILSSLALLGVLVVVAAVVGRAGEPELLAPLAGIGLSIMAGLLVLVGLPLVFNLLFASRDVEILFTLPIPTRSIFLVKYGQVLVNTGSLALLGGALPLVAYGIAAGVAWLFYPVALLTVVATVAASLALCALIALAVVRFIPAQRAKELMTAMAMLAGLLGAFSGQLAGRTSINDVSDLPVLPLWAPTRWGAEALSQAAEGSLASLLPLAALAILGGGLLLGATALVERGFRVGWVQMQEGPAARPKRRRTRTTRDLPSPAVAIALKDLRVLQRDFREWMSLAPFLVFFGIALVNILRGGGDLAELAGNPRGLWLLVQGGLVLILGSFAANLSAPALAREEQGLWVMRTAPLSGWQIAIGKFGLYWAIMLALLAVVEIAAGILLGWAFGWIVAGFAAMAMLIAGAVALGLAVGTLGAKYDPEKPAERLTTGVTFLLLGVQITYVVLAMIPAALILIPTGLGPEITRALDGAGGPIYLFLRGALFIEQQKLAHGELVTAIGLLWLVVYGLGVAWLMLAFTAGRIDAGVQVRIAQGR